MKKGARGTGLAVDPARVKRARVAAGLSLAQVARSDVSRTFLYLVEQGRSRPSKPVLALIARRTGKPMSYFLKADREGFRENRALASDLTKIAYRVRRFISDRSLTKPESEAMKLIELGLRQAAVLTAAVQKELDRA